MNSKCKKIQKKLSSYLDKQLIEGECREIENHLQHCVLCSKEREILEQSWVLLDNVKSITVLSSFESKVWRKIYIHEQEKNKSFLENILNLKPVTAIAMLFLGIISGWFLGNTLYYQKSVANDTISQQQTLFYLDNFDDLPADSVGGVLLNILKEV